MMKRGSLVAAKASPPAPCALGGSCSSDRCHGPGQPATAVVSRQSQLHGMGETTTEWVDMVMDRLHSTERCVDALRQDNDRLRRELARVTRQVQFAPWFRGRVDYFFAIPMAREECPSIARLAVCLNNAYAGFTITYMPDSVETHTLIAVLTCHPFFHTCAEASQAFSASLLASGCRPITKRAMVYAIRCSMVCEAVIAARDPDDYARRWRGPSDPLVGVDALLAGYEDRAEFEHSRAMRDFVGSEYLYRHFEDDLCKDAIDKLDACVVESIWA